MARRGPKPRPVPDRFDDLWTPVPYSGCWLWEGAVDADGYGRMRVGSRGEGRRTLKAHRLSYELHLGPVPDGHSVRRACEVACCVNPDHLRLHRMKRRRRKLSAEEQAAIRARLARGDHRAAIAADYEVTRTYVYLLASGRRR